MQTTLTTSEPFSKEEFAKQRRLRAECRKIANRERAERVQCFRETGYPVRFLHGFVEAMADLPELSGTYQQYLHQCQSEAVL